MQEFDYSVIHRPGQEHAIADYLSRLPHGEVPTEQIDDLPDSDLFSVDLLNLEDSWIEDMTQFLNSGLPPEHTLVVQRKKMAWRSRSFEVINGSPLQKGH